MSVVFPFPAYLSLSVKLLLHTFNLMSRLGINMTSISWKHLEICVLVSHIRSERKIVPDISITTIIFTLWILGNVS